MGSLAQTMLMTRPDQGSLSRQFPSNPIPLDRLLLLESAQRMMKPPLAQPESVAEVWKEVSWLVRKSSQLISESCAAHYGGVCRLALSATWNAVTWGGTW
jgi:hypothetical protein